MRALYEIAGDVRANWKNVKYSAEPYLAAMESMGSVNEKYGQEDGKFIVLYFLSNASGWRGEKAKAIKTELKAMVK